MKNKIIGILLTVLIFAVPMSIVIFRGQANVAPEPDDSVKVVYTNIFTPVEGSAIAGPREAQVGELIRLQVKGDQVKWQVLPSVPDIETYGAANEKAVISFRRAGEYTIIAAVLSDKTVTLETIKIVVGGFTPTPGPGPGPNNPPVGPKVDTDLSGKVKQWASEGRVDKQLSAKLAANFSQVASEISNGSLKTTGEIINRTATLNQSLDLKGFDGVMAKIQAYLTQQADSGILITPEQHVTVWFSIASGLEGYAREPSGSKR